MTQQPFSLNPTEVRVLAQCPLHYHFLQQKSTVELDPELAKVDELVREVLQQLHAAGGPARMSLRECLEGLHTQRVARQMVERYYRRLEREWSQMIASNETMELRISLGGVSLELEATVDRLDKTSDGGILAILFRTEPPPIPTAASLRRDHAMTIYHSLVAATYPLRRPVRIQELWLRTNESVTIELSEEEYRRNLSDLRDPVIGLAKGEVMARPGLHCDTCPFKHHGCPVYAHEVKALELAAKNKPLDPNDVSQPILPKLNEITQGDDDDFVSPSSDGKISPRKWIFKLGD